MLKRLLQGFNSIYVKKQYLILFAILFIGLLIRLWIVNERWINPDEGAHIMDGKLVLDGLVPEVDYESRQVVYVYIIAFILKLLGAGYLSVRMLPLISTLFISVMIYLISKRLFNEKVALLAAGIYTFLPLSVLESAIVKTEPVTILLGCVGIYLVILGIERHRSNSLLFFLSGMFLALAFYVRESSLAILLAVFLILLISYSKEVRTLIRTYVFVLSGYIFVCLMVFAYYSQYLTVSQIWKSPMNPLNIVSGAVQKVLGLLFPEVKLASASIVGAPNAYDSWNSTLYYLNLTLFTHAFLFVGLLFSIILFAYSYFAGRRCEETPISLFSLSFLYSWLSSLGFAYLYWMINRGYYIQYFAEFLPPLSIILAFVITYSFSKFGLERNQGRNIAFISLLLLILFFLHSSISELEIKSILYPLTGTLGLAFFYFSPALRFKNWLYILIPTGLMIAAIFKLASLSPYFIKAILYLTALALLYLAIFAATGLKLRRDFKAGMTFVAFSLMLSALALSSAVSGRGMGLAFDSGWSPKTVKEVSEYIRANSRQDAEILSGAVIWEVESDRRPFMNVTHPLRYLPGISQLETKEIEEGLAKRPPNLIVLDGYTEKTYLKHINKLQAIIDEKYELKKVVDGSRKPVRIYELKDTPT